MPRAQLALGEIHPPSRPGSRVRAGYGVLSTRPLHILVFLSPLIALYELGSIFYLSDANGVQTVNLTACRMLAGFFEAFGVAGFHLPGIAVITVLLVQHFLQRDRWSVRPPVIVGMLLESLGWVLPLLVFTVLLQGVLPGRPAAGAPLQSLGSLSWQAKVTISIGAGLYEELLFRMILIAALHLILVDICKFGENLGRLAAVLVSTIAFALYHGDVRLSGGGLNVPVLLQLSLAGLYFGFLFIFRGYGIAAAVHATYDILALVLFPAPASG